VWGYCDVLLTANACDQAPLDEKRRARKGR